MALDGLILQGNIELHVRSSDWYLHGHETDEAYNNVILHVVYEHDRDVFINDVPVPTIELKPFIDLEHYERTLSFTASPAAIPCATQLDDCPLPVFWNQVEHALFQRMERKAAGVAAIGVQVGGDPRKVLFHAIAGAFGMKVNQLPFQELAHRLPFERLLKAEAPSVEAVVFGASGLLPAIGNDAFQQQLASEWHYQQARLHLHPANAHSWHFKGCRPGGFPTLRLAQFATFVHAMDWSAAFWELPVKTLRQYLEEALTAEPSPYWTAYYDFGKEKVRPRSGRMSLASAQVVLVNSVVPFLWWLSDELLQPVFREKAMELLELLPTEKNVLLRAWSEKGADAKSAAESQGLLELKNEFCNRKQCLHCKVGLSILKR